MHFRVFLTLVGVFWIAFAASLGAIRRVPQDYGTIQAALDAVVEDDTIMVSLGTYAEELLAPPLRFWLIGDVPIDTGDFPKPIIDPSTLDSAQWRRCLTLPLGSEPTIERMKFVNRASMFPRADSFGWGGIVLHTDGPVTLRHCAFDSTWGAVVFWPPPPYGRSRIVVEDSRFTYGQRVQVRSSGSVVIERCVFLDGRHTGFVSCHDSCRMEDCVFTGDSIFTAVWLGGGNGVLRNNVFGPIDTCVARIVQLADTPSSLMEDNLFHDIRLVSWEHICAFSVRTAGTVRFRRNQLINTRAPTGGVAFYVEVPPDDPAVALAEIDSNLFLNMVADCTGAQQKALDLWDYCKVRGNRFIDLSPASVACVYASLANGRPPSEFRTNVFQAGDYAIRSPWDTEDAVWNYWGDPLGPYNLHFNPGSSGARVDDSVRFDPWCPDTNCFLSVPGIGQPLPKEFVFEAYPNPFNSTLHLTLIPSEIGIVKVELFDVLGRKASEIWHGPLAFQKDVTFDASELASGIYFAKVTDVISRKNLAMAKMVMLK